MRRTNLRSAPALATIQAFKSKNNFLLSHSYGTQFFYSSWRKYYSTDISKIKTIGVVGAGQMGSGIAQVSATAEFNVILMDANEQIVKKSITNIDGILSKNVAKGKLSADQKQNIINRIQTTSSFQSFANCDIVIEAVTESYPLKQSIFSQLGGVCPEHTIFASNTSSISITKMASVVPKRADKFIGMHFMNPVPVMKLVEIIPGLNTSQETIDTTITLAKKMDKETAISDDRPGFIANRLLMPYINDAIKAFESGLGKKEDIDTTMKLGCNMPMGPLQLADLIGLDTCLFILKVLNEELGDQFKPSPLLVKYVDAGKLGRKSGEGFYKYSK